MKPHETLSTAEDMFNRLRAEQAMLDGLEPRRQGLIDQLTRLVNTWPAIIPFHKDISSSCLFAFQTGEIEGRQRQVYVSATVKNDTDDDLPKGGLNFYVEVAADEDVGVREVFEIFNSLAGRTKVVEFMSEYLPDVRGGSDPRDMRDLLDQTPNVSLMESLEESLTQLYSVNPALAPAPVAATS